MEFVTWLIINCLKRYFPVMTLSTSPLAHGDEIRSAMLMPIAHLQSSRWSRAECSSESIVRPTAYWFLLITILLSRQVEVRADQPRPATDLHHASLAVGVERWQRHLLQQLYSHGDDDPRSTALLADPTSSAGLHGDDTRHLPHAGRGLEAQTKPDNDLVGGSRLHVSSSSTASARGCHSPNDARSCSIPEDRDAWYRVPGFLQPHQGRGWGRKELAPAMRHMGDLRHVEPLFKKLDGGRRVVAVAIGSSYVQVGMKHGV